MEETRDERIDRVLGRLERVGHGWMFYREDRKYQIFSSEWGEAWDVTTYCGGVSVSQPVRLRSTYSCEAYARTINAGSPEVIAHDLSILSQVLQSKLINLAWDREDMGFSPKYALLITELTKEEATRIGHDAESQGHQVKMREEG